MNIIIKSWEERQRIVARTYPSETYNRWKNEGADLHWLIMAP